MIDVACATLSCDGFGNMDFKKAFEMLPQIGYKYVEFDCWHPADLTPNKMKDIKKRCDDSGLIPMGIYSNGFGGIDKNQISKDVSHKIRMIEAACELGCKRVVATGAGRGKDGGLDSIITVLNEVSYFAETQGILVCLENHAGNNLENTEDYLRIFKEVNSPNVGMCMDTGHFITCSVDMDEQIDLFGKRIFHVHVKEKKENSDEVIYFAEHNHRVIKHLVSAGYDGFITVEIPPLNLDPDIIRKELKSALNTYSIYSKV